MTSIGRRCRGGNVYSRAILITQTLSGTEVPPKINRLLIYKRRKVRKQKNDAPFQRNTEAVGDNLGKVCESVSETPSISLYPKRGTDSRRKRLRWQ